MKALITGSNGFVGPYLREELLQHGYDVAGIDLKENNWTRKCDLLNPEEVTRVITEECPDYVFHLAAQANVGKSWQQPALTLELNVVAAVNLLESIRKNNGYRTKVVVVGSSDQYGNLGEMGKQVTEDMNLKPGNPYAISKQAQEELACLYVKNYGMKICMTRSFNHGGYGQRTGFIIPDFASGIARIERGEQETLMVGNLSSSRDFTHVKDVVRAYRLIAEKGLSGEIYNVGSGKTYSIQDILDKLIRLSYAEIKVCTDPKRMRPSDTPVICCDRTKITKDTGWIPELSIDDILKDTLTYYRNQKQ